MPVLLRSAAGNRRSGSGPLASSADFYRIFQTVDHSVVQPTPFRSLGPVERHLTANSLNFFAGDFLNPQLLQLNLREASLLFAVAHLLTQPPRGDFTAPVEPARGEGGGLRGTSASCNDDLP